MLNFSDTWSGDWVPSTEYSRPAYCSLVIAHMGGLHEIGLFLIPAILGVLAMRWAEKRARRRAEAERGEAAAGTSGEQPPG